MVGLVSVGMAAGVAAGLAMDGGAGMPGVPAGQDGLRAGTFSAADARRESCDDDCVRSRGAAALLVLSQRPAP